MYANYNMSASANPGSSQPVMMVPALNYEQLIEQQRQHRNKLIQEHNEYIDKQLMEKFP